MADVVGHGDLELVAEAGEVLAEGLAAGREGAGGRRQRGRVAAGVRLRALLAQAVLLRADERHLVFVVNLEVGDGEVNHRDYERGCAARWRAVIDFQSGLRRNIVEYTLRGESNNYYTASDHTSTRPAVRGKIQRVATRGCGAIRRDSGKKTKN